MSVVTLTLFCRPTLLADNVGRQNDNDASCEAALKVKTGNYNKCNKALYKLTFTMRQMADLYSGFLGGHQHFLTNIKQRAVSLRRLSFLYIQYTIL